MERSSVTRYLRYTVTALSLTACVLLIALWVRSYRNGISWAWLFSDRQHVAFHSQVGSLYLIWRTENKLPPNPHFAPDELDSELASQMLDLFKRKSFTTPRLSLSCPHWLAAIIAAVFAVAPWLLYRFTLRTLLIATTLVAVVLGIFVAAQ